MDGGSVGTHSKNKQSGQQTQSSKSKNEHYKKDPKQMQPTASMPQQVHMRQTSL